MKPKVGAGRVFFSATVMMSGNCLAATFRLNTLLAEGLPISQKNGCQGDNCQKGTGVSGRASASDGVRV